MHCAALRYFSNTRALTRAEPRIFLQSVRGHRGRQNSRHIADYSATIDAGTTGGHHLGGPGPPGPAPGPPGEPCSARGAPSTGPFHSEHGHARKRASRRPAAAADAAEAAARAMPTLPTHTPPAAPSAAALEHMQRPETTKTRLKRSERAFREGRSGREFEALTADKSPVRAPSKARMMPVEVAVRWANVIKAGERKQGCQPAHRMSRRAARRRPRAISSHQCLGRWAGACCRRAAFGARWRHRWRPLGVLGRPVVDKLLLQQLRTASRHRRCTLEAQASPGFVTPNV